MEKRGYETTEAVIMSKTGEIKIPKIEVRRGKKSEDKMNENFSKTDEKYQNMGSKVSYKQIRTKTSKCHT